MVQVKAKTALENFNDDGHFLISFRRGGGEHLFYQQEVEEVWGASWRHKELITMDGSREIAEKGRRLTDR